MKKLLTLTLTLIALTLTAHAGDEDLYKALQLYQFYQTVNSPMTVPAQPAYYQPRIPAEVYMAYPDNPSLYRYLNRNPRYIDLYLGR